MTYDIIDSVWWSPPLNDLITDAITGASRNLQIGIVAIRSGPDGAWKCYIGHGTTGDQTQDELRVAEHGMPLGSAAAAVGFFPSQDIKKYRY